MRVTGVGLRVLTVCAAAALAGGLSAAQAQTGPAPPGAVGMNNAAKPPADPVVAVVNNNTIHLSDVGDTIRTMPGGNAENSLETLFPVALRALVSREALLIRAQIEGVDQDPAVQRHMRQAANQVLENAYVQKATAKLLTDQMLTARYDAEIRGKPGPEEVHGHLLIVPTEAQAQEIIAKLAAGADFAGLARQSGNDTVAKIGGDIGFVRREGLGPEVGAVLFSLRPGEVTPYPVHTPVGWFVLQAGERRLAPTPTFSEVRNRLQGEAEAAQVPAVMKAALTAVTVRTYDISGQ